MKAKQIARVRVSLALALAMGGLFFGSEAKAQTTGGTLRIAPVQILNTNGNRVCQHVFDSSSGTYRLAWRSADLGGIPSVRLGDVDNDGQLEIVASVYYVSRIAGKKPNQTTYYDSRIYAFRSGAAFNAGPDWSTGELGELPNTLVLDSWVGDVDNDGSNEFALIRTNLLEVYHIIHGTGPDAAFTVQSLRSYPNWLFSMEVGDADNRGDNEILVACAGQPFVWKCTNGQWLETAADPVPTAYYGAGMTSVGLTYLRVRNADNAPGNEIIATGNNQRLMVWEHDGGGYKWSSVSADLNGSMTYGIDSGNVDGDTLNAREVVVNLWGTKKLPARIVIMAFEGGVWVLKNTYNCGYADLRDMRVGDLDGDGRAEVALQCNGPTPGLRVLHFGGDLLTGTFSEVYVGPGDPYHKIEIR